MTAAIEFSDEQTMLLETAADFCRNTSPIARVRAQLEAPNDDDTGVWQQMTDLGWLGIAIAEEHGGLGLGLADVVPVVESMGRQLMVSPFVATTLAAHTLTTSGSAAQQAEWLPKIAAGAVATVALTEEDGNWDLEAIVASGTLHGDQLRLSGSKCFVLDAALAQVIIASVSIDDQTRLVILRSDQLLDSALERETVVDGTRRSYRLDLHGITIDANQVLPHTDLRAVEQAALLLLCAEISGGLAGVLHVIVEYLNTRKAFDRLIGSYQALKHPTVDILMGYEGCRSHLYHAATVMAQGDADAAEIALRMAKAQGSDAFAFAGDRAVQFHGGFGFTWECDAQLYLRRALWCQYQFGDARHHRQRLAPLLLDLVG